MEIKDYVNGNEEDIRALYRAAYNRSLDIDLWKWRFTNNPFGNHFLKLMWDNDILAGHYSVSASKLVAFGEEITGALSMITMTHPDYNKRGIFTSLANALFQEFQGNLKIIYGFPNNNSYHGFVSKLGWKHIADIKPYWIDTMGKSFQWKERYMLVKVNSFDEEIYKLDKNLNTNRIHVRRDSVYLNWRYTNNPSNKYHMYEIYDRNEIVGFCCYKLYQDVQRGRVICDVVDFLCMNTDIFEDMIYFIIKSMAQEDVCYIDLWTSIDVFGEVLKNIGFIVDEDNVTHFCAMKNSSEDYLNSTTEIENWYITMGDSDIY